ncbi:C39 family peptidase [Heyndrickxia acidicola]|uniref:C39 family peptidase n=1 Tax=Heyndrickxia acidicola TaxID=209389 RepID=A0ABU6MJA5_9BACI|nr:C39 family peptidase [Heyndrickxia acidicola]MED1203743.1 C39 family peptidase [Heyndrickxia acidicola]
MKNLIFTILLAVLIVCAADKRFINTGKPIIQQVSKETASTSPILKTTKVHTQAKVLKAPKQKVSKKLAVKSLPRRNPSAHSAKAANRTELLNVPLYNQMSSPRLYNGCEVTSLAMVLNYNGYHVTKNELAETIHTVPLYYQNGENGNPNEGFVGNMQDGPGLGVYHGPILKLAQKYAGKKAVDLTGSPFSKILKQIDQNHPVWIITTSTFAPVSNFRSWKTPEGLIQISFSMHSVVITGYDQKHIYINNPYGIKNQRVDRQSFIKAWDQMGKQAITITRHP